MPIVRIEMYQGRTHEQKAELAKVITNALVNIAKAKPEDATIVFYDVAKENVAKAGVMVSDIGK